MTLVKKTSVNILKNQNLTGINAAFVTFKDLNEVIDVVNDITDGTQSFAEYITDTTESTSGATGALIVDGGIGSAKRINSTTAIAAGTTLTSGTAVLVGTDITLATAVNHTVAVADSLVNATAGADLTIKAAAGLTSGNGGATTLKSGVADLTGAGGILTLISGAGGATSGASGAVNINSGVATIGSSGTITIASGNTASGVAGDIKLVPGTHTSATVSPVVSLEKAVIYKPTLKSIAINGGGGTLTGPELLGGYVEATGATGPLTLPSAADITTAIGSTPAGTKFQFTVNAVGMTAGNIVTITPGANTTTQKMISAGDSATDQLLTVTNTSNVNIGIFMITYITPTTCSLHRIG